MCRVPIPWDHIDDLLVHDPTGGGSIVDYDDLAGGGMEPQGEIKRRREVGRFVDAGKEPCAAQLGWIEVIDAAEYYRGARKQVVTVCQQKIEGIIVGGNNGVEP